MDISPNSDSARLEATADSCQPILFLAYHFAPSAEIGARRITACAVDLANHGFPIQVISAFGNLGPKIDTLPGRIRSTWVREKPARILKSMAAAKRWLTRLFFRLVGRRQVNVTSQSIGSPGVPKASTSWLVRVATLIDIHKKWSLFAAVRACIEGRANGARAVFASGPPMSSLVAAMWVAKFLRVPLVLDMRDPWIAGSGLEGQRNSLEKWVGCRFEKAAFSRARIIFTATQGMAERICRCYPSLAKKVHIVRNGYDGELRAALTSTNHRLDILFAGEIYVNRNPFPFLESVERLLARADVDPSKIRVTFVGHCEEHMRQSLQDWVQNRRCASVVKFLAPVSYDVIMRLSQEATVLLNLAQQGSVMIPAKAYEHVASGREVLIISEPDTDVSMLFRDIPGICCVDSRSSTALDAALVDYYHRHVIEGKSKPPETNIALPFSRVAQNETLRRILFEHGFGGSKH